MAEKVFIKHVKKDVVRPMDKALFVRTQENINKDGWQLLEGEALKGHLKKIKAVAPEPVKPVAKITGEAQPITKRVKKSATKPEG